MIIYTPENQLKVIAKAQEFLGEKLLGREEKTDYHQFRVQGKDVKDFIRFLKTDPELAFTMFIDLTAADYLKYPEVQPGRFGIVYTFLSAKLGVKVQVKAFVDGVDARIDSIVDLFAGANWTEREVWDLYGIEFIGHPNLKRILMPDDYEGYPLRKDYPLKGRGERGNFPVYHASTVKPAGEE